MVYKLNLVRRDMMRLQLAFGKFTQDVYFAMYTSFSEKYNTTNQLDQAGNMAVQCPEQFSFFPCTVL